MSGFRALALATALIACSGTSASAQLFRVLAPLPATRSFQAHAVSDNGNFVAGYCNVPGGLTVPTLWNSARAPVALSMLGVADAVYAVSDDGLVAAGLSVNAQSQFRAAVWTPDAKLVLGEGRAVAVDPSGRVVAGWLTGDGTPTGFSYTMSDGLMHELSPAEGDTRSEASSVDAAGLVVAGSTGGWVDEDSYSRACVWNAAGGPPIVLDSLGMGAGAEDLSADGRVVVGWASDGVGSAAVRWVDGVCEIIIPLSMRATAMGVSADGLVVVGSCEQLDGAFVWDAAHGARSLRTLMSEAGYDMSRIQLWESHGISGDGLSIVGLGSSQITGQHIGWEIVLETRCAADFDRNFVLDFFDYLDFVMAFSAEDPRADFNANGSIDFFDYLDFMIAFDAGCD
jgi:uncharacterized membrane protein